MKKKLQIENWLLRKRRGKNLEKEKSKHNKHKKKFIYKIKILKHKKYV